MQGPGQGQAPGLPSASDWGAGRRGALDVGQHRPLTPTPTPPRLPQASGEPSSLSWSHFPSRTRQWPRQCNPRSPRSLHPSAPPFPYSSSQDPSQTPGALSLPSPPLSRGEDMGMHWGRAPQPTVFWFLGPAVGQDREEREARREDREEVPGAMVGVGLRGSREGGQDLGQSAISSSPSPTKLSPTGLLFRRTPATHTACRLTPAHLAF